MQYHQIVERSPFRDMSEARFWVYQHQFFKPKQCILVLQFHQHTITTVTIIQNGCTMFAKQKRIFVNFTTGFHGSRFLQKIVIFSSDVHRLSASLITFGAEITFFCVVFPAHSIKLPENAREQHILRTSEKSAETPQKISWNNFGKICFEK